MYFSCDNKDLLHKIHPIIIKIINDEGYVINDKKTHFHTPSNRKQITGITVVDTENTTGNILKAKKDFKKNIRKFNKDIPDLIYQPYNWSKMDEYDLDELSSLLESRKEYLHKKDMDDICKYDSTDLTSASIFQHTGSLFIFHIFSVLRSPIR